MAEKRSFSWEAKRLTIHLLDTPHSIYSQSTSAQRSLHDQVMHTLVAAKTAFRPCTMSVFAV